MTRKSTKSTTTQEQIESEILSLPEEAISLSWSEAIKRDGIASTMHVWYTSDGQYFVARCQSLKRGPDQYPDYFAAYYRRLPSSWSHIESDRLLGPGYPRHYTTLEQAVSVVEQFHCNRVGAVVEFGREGIMAARKAGLGLLPPKAGAKPEFDPEKEVDWSSFKEFDTI